MAHPANHQLPQLLRETSRSFYLTLRVLPGKIRPQISLAYLLARASDTIADTEILPAAQRLHALANFRERLQGGRAAALDFSELARHQGTPAERRLLEQCEHVFAVMAAFSRADQQRLRETLAIIISGQELDLQRFGAAAPPTGTGAPDIVALQTDAELDDYTYRVAGCVGEFWTKLCRAHLFPGARVDEALLLKNGVRFGKGLQLVNILRDLPADLRKGRCYVPAASLAQAGLRPADLLEPANEPRFRPLYHRLLDRAEAHLAAGWAYTNGLPRGCGRVRLACAWPILIGRETLTKLRGANVLDPAQRIKVSRGEVRRILCRSLIRHPFPRLWRRLVPDRGPIA